MIFWVASVDRWDTRDIFCPQGSQEVLEKTVLPVLLLSGNVLHLKTGDRAGQAGGAVSGDGCL